MIKMRRDFIKKFIKILLISMVSIMLFGCSSDDNRAEELQRIRDKGATNAPMTKSEREQLDSFNSWKKENDAEEYNKKNY